MTSRLRELDENLLEFIQICNNSPTSRLLDYIGAPAEDQEAIEGPLNTDSIEGDQTMLVGLLNPLESARSQPRSPSKLKLKDVGGIIMSQDDSFLQPMGEEQEIHKIVQTQRKTIEKLNKDQVILENKISALKKKIEEMSLQAKKKTKEMKSMIQQKMAQNKNSSDAEKAQLTSELNAIRKELNENQVGVTEKGTRISQLTAENESLKK